MSLFVILVGFLCNHCKKVIEAPNARTRDLHISMCKAVMEEGKDSINCIFRSDGLFLLHYQNAH